MVITSNNVISWNNIYIYIMYVYNPHNYMVHHLELELHTQVCHRSTMNQVPTLQHEMIWYLYLEVIMKKSIVYVYIYNNYTIYNYIYIYVHDIYIYIIYRHLDLAFSMRKRVPWFQTCVFWHWPWSRVRNPLGHPLWFATSLARLYGNYNC